jgi:hypothetical protein
MSPATEQVFQAAMSLPDDQQHELIDALLAARTAAERPTESAWNVEAERRFEAILAGRAATRPLEELLAELHGRRS